MAVRQEREKRVFQKRKVCRYCADKNLIIDYKDFKSLKYFTTERGEDNPQENIRQLCAPSAEGDSGNTKGQEHSIPSVLYGK